MQYRGSLKSVRGLLKCIFRHRGCLEVRSQCYFFALFLSGDSFTSHVIGRGKPLQSNEFERELLKAPNGSTLSIDWMDSPESIPRKFIGLVVVFNHGYGGNIVDYVVRRIIGECHRHKLGCCIVNMQGVAGVPVSVKGPCTGLSLSYVIELKAVTERIVQHVGERFPKSALSLSLGGVPLIEYLSQDKHSYTSSVLISVPLDVERFAQSDNVVTRQCLHSAKSILKANADAMTEWDHEAVRLAMEAQSIGEIHRVLKCRPLPSFESMHAALDVIEEPILLMHALDDDSVDFTRSVDLYRLCRNKNIAVSVTQVGGHCASVTVNNRSTSWLGSAALEFVASSMRPYA